VILVTGGTGFVGRHLVPRLIEAGKEVRVLSRSGSGVSGAQAAQGDVREASSVTAAAQGCSAAVHLAGIIRESHGMSFRDVHVEGTRTVLRACRDAEISRFLHMSALGTRPDARSACHQTKWQAEELVRKSGMKATIFRPSVMVGAGNSFLPRMRDLVRAAPVVPIIGDGMSLLQPIWVGDVVSCLLASLEGPAMIGHTYELGGPETFGFEQLPDIAAEEDGVGRPRVHFPARLIRPVVALMGRVVPGFPVTTDQLTMLLEDNVCDITEMRDVFGVEPARLSDHLGD
jgi:NADH dehydrogenase